MRILRSLILLFSLAVASAGGHAATEPAPEKVRHCCRCCLTRRFSAGSTQQRAGPTPFRLHGGIECRGRCHDGRPDRRLSAPICRRSELPSPRVRGALAEAAARVHGEMAAHGIDHLFLLLAAFAALGFGVERLFWMVSGGVRRWIIASRMDTPGERLRAMLARFGFGASWVAAFALGTIGAFLAFDWPPRCATRCCACWWPW